MVKQEATRVITIRHAMEGLYDAVTVLETMADYVEFGESKTEVAPMVYVLESICQAIREVPEDIEDITNKISEQTLRLKRILLKKAQIEPTEETKADPEYDMESDTYPSEISDELAKDIRTRAEQMKDLLL